MNGAELSSFWKRHAREILIGALALLTIHDVFGAHGFLAMWRTRRQLRQLHDEVQQLTQENRRLADQVHALKSDPKEIERIAREQMGLARPGEMIFKLPPGSETSANSPATTEKR